MKTLLLPCVALLSLLSLPATAQGTRVWKVGGGGQFSDIQTAVDSASEGDLILVRTGAYSAFFLRSKSLGVLAAQGDQVTITGEVHVEDLTAGQLVVIGNLECAGSSNPNPATAALVARNNLGALVLRTATLRCGLGTQGGDGREAVRLLQSEIVVFDQCQLRGGQSAWLYNQAGAGLFSRRAHVAAFRSSFTGGQGFQVPCDGFYWGYDGGAGAPGYESPEGFLFVAGGSIQGGRGGSPGPEDWEWDWYTGQWIYHPPGTAGPGGPGILLGSLPPSSLDPHAELLSITPVGGQPGDAYCGYAGVPGQGIEIRNGSTNTLPGTTREVTLPSLAHENTLVSFEARGAPGERVYLMTSKEPDFRFDANLSGCSLIRMPLFSTRSAVGVIPASGLLQAQILTRSLRPGDEAGTFLVQALFVPPSGPTRISNATTIALVDPSVSLD